MSRLEVMRQFIANLTYKHTSCKQTVFVVKDLKQNLLGLPAITSMNLISRLNSVDLSSTNVQKLYPQPFQGLGTFGEEYEVSLKDDAKPIALHTARNVPLPLHTKVRDELKRMESMGVISPVIYLLFIVLPTADVFTRAATNTKFIIRIFQCPKQMNAKRILSRVRIIRS